MNDWCSGDETLKPTASIAHGSISSDEENETSLDISCHSDYEDETSTDSDEDGHTHTVPCGRQQQHATQVRALRCLVIQSRVYFRPLKKRRSATPCHCKKGVELPLEHIKRGSYSYISGPIIDTTNYWYRKTTDFVSSLHY